MPTSPRPAPCIRMSIVVAVITATITTCAVTIVASDERASGAVGSIRDRVLPPTPGPAPAGSGRATELAAGGSR